MYHVSMDDIEGNVCVMTMWLRPYYGMRFVIRVFIFFLAFLLPGYQKH